MARTRTAQRIGQWVAMPAVYVAGENVPAQDEERRAAAAETALTVIHQPTVEEILEQFARWMRLDVGDGAASPATLRSYFSDVRQHLCWLFGQGISPAQADEEVLKDWRAFLLGEGAPGLLEPDDPRAPECYSISTVGRKLASVRRFYQMAHARGALPSNPAEGLKAPKDRTDRAERVKFLTLAAVQRVLQAPDVRTVKGMRDRAILVLMAMHGLRVAEVAGLDLGDLDPEAGEAGTLTVIGKGSKQRVIYLTFDTRQEVNRWLSARQLMDVNEAALFLATHQNGHGPAGRLGVRGIRMMVDVYLRAVGAKAERVSCHSLRHSYATHSLAFGAKLAAISKSMGHSSLNTTMVYAHIVDRARENPARFLTGMLAV